MRGPMGGAMRGPMGRGSRRWRGLAPVPAPVAALFDAVQQRRVQEELCVLYVAMTRAVHRLDLLVRARRGDKPACTAAALVREALDDGHGTGDVLTERTTAGLP